MNYKKKLLRYVKKSNANGMAYFEEEGKDTKALKKAHDLTYAILKTRFKNELKQYNNDKKKAYDEFVAKKNLAYLRIYIEEFLLLDKKEKKVDFYHTVRIHMRTLLNELFHEVKKS